jgi:iron(III) transport system permease protein
MALKTKPERGSSAAHEMNDAFDDVPATGLQGLADRVRSQSMRLFALSVLAALVYLIVLPLATTFWGSFRSGAPGTDASYTLENYRTAYGQASLYRALWNTLIFAFGSTILALLVGGYLAWLTQRTNIRGKGFIYAFAMLPAILPSAMSTVAWLVLLNPTIGWVNHYFEAWFGLDWQLTNAYSMPWMIWVQGIDHFSLPFLLLASTLRSMDPSLEEASETSGASTFRTLRTVTFPLMRPAVIASALLLTLRALEGFEVPAILGIPAGKSFLATVVWQQTLGQPDYSLAAAFAVGYVGIAMIGLVMYYRSTRGEDRFATVKGKAFRTTVLDLGRWRRVHQVGAATILFIGVVLPIVAIVWSSTQPFLSPINGQSWDRRSLDAYRDIFDQEIVTKAFSNSIQVGLVSSAVCVLLAVLTSWIVIRTRFRGRKVLDAIAFLPIGIPGIVISLAVLYFYLQTGVPLYGTLAIIGVAYIAGLMPIAQRVTHAALTQIDAELEEASEAAGASRVRTFRKIVLPLIAPGLMVAFIYVLTLSFRVLSLPIMLFTSGNEVVSTIIYTSYIGGQYDILAATGVLLMMLLLSLTIVAFLIARRFGGVQREG